MRRRTSIVISHRVSTARQADRVLVLDDGTLAEEGTHDELVIQSGRYQRMIALQTAEPVG